jgi:spermidine synthase
MRPWDIIDREEVPGEEETVYLMCRGSEYVIQVDGRELMSNKLHGSEDALADLACDRLEHLEDARILVGGLGMGFTLSAALRRVGPKGQVTVAELIPAVVRWNQGLLSKVAKHPLRDSRSVVYAGDVGDLVEKAEKPWSAILLDVDNGPEALTRPYNGWLYSRQGIQAAYNALIPGGVLGVWSAAADSNLSRRLRKGRFEVEVLFHTEPGRPTQDGSGTHTLWMAKRPSARAE